ncbi:hypothetical protein CHINAEXTREME_15675 [Halobiforma lacisalsi AJ5]|uniref:Uncharacterized protein n=2 Tax=Natronobacterium TaxID=2256 RepID=M0LCU1_NATLA|nr:MULTISPECIES: hypothetical protein [Halobiforma]APW99121.1 hypothetical protein CHINAEXTREME_15675 [Halobiforma lacisalsi AJ5]EMA30928.1 hypothetical protein C445_15281 [Halobiforma lacisalsi AJ5]SFB97653.1 hypothetical protein SAMN05444422_103314 [Halobiforma haloterrestris]
MIQSLDDYFPTPVTKTTVYHAFRLGLQLYIGALLVAGAYSLFWLAEVAGIIPETLLSTIWIAIAVMGMLLLVLLIPLLYTSRSNER